MRMLILAAAAAMAVTSVQPPEAAAQTVGARAGQPMARGGDGMRGHRHRGGRRAPTDAVARLDRRLALARLRGDDPSRDIHSGFRWGSPGEIVRRRDRDGFGGGGRSGPGDDFALCRIWRHDMAGQAPSELMHCGRARGFADNIPGISVIGPDAAGRPGQPVEAAPPVAAAAPAVRTLDARRIVRGPTAEAPAQSFAIRTVGRP